MKHFHRVANAALCLAATLVVAGCAGYHIGPIKPSYLRDINSIAVPVFKNDTLLPRVEALVTNTVIKQFQQDGTYRIASAENADAVLEGVITKVTRRSVRSVRGNILATREFELTLTVEYVLKRRDTGEKIEHGTANGGTAFFVSGDLQQDERQAIPLAAEEAALNIVNRLSEGW